MNRNTDNDDRVADRGEGNRQEGAAASSSSRDGGGDDERRTEGAENPADAGSGSSAGVRSTASSRKRAREETTSGTADTAAESDTAAAVGDSGSALPSAAGTEVGSRGGGRAPVRGSTSVAREDTRAGSAAAASARIGRDDDVRGVAAAEQGSTAALSRVAAALQAAAHEREIAQARERVAALQAALWGRPGIPPPHAASSSSSSGPAAALSSLAALDLPTQLRLLSSSSSSSRLPTELSDAQLLSSILGQPPALSMTHEQLTRSLLQEYLESQTNSQLLARYMLLPSLLPPQQQQPQQQQSSLDLGALELLRAQQALTMQRDAAAIAAALSGLAPAYHPLSYPLAHLQPLARPSSSSFAPPDEDEQKESSMSGGMRRAIWPSSAMSPFRRLVDDPSSSLLAGSDPSSSSPPIARLPASASSAPPHEPQQAPLPPPPPPPAVRIYQQPNVPCRFHAKAINVSLPTDGDSTSKFQALLRDQMLYVEAVSLDVQASTQGRNRPIRVGQVGILCRHCRNIPPRNRPRGAIYFPHKLLSIYQSAQNMANHHYTPDTGCPNAPDSVNDALRVARSDKSIVYGGGQQYWARAASESGLVETEDGLAFAPATATSTSTASPAAA